MLLGRDCGYGVHVRGDDGGRGGVSLNLIVVIILLIRIRK
jgi:hypothetical protein